MSDYVLYAVAFGYRWYNDEMGFTVLHYMVCNFYGL